METSKRLVALDVFRGLTIALMIVVNNPGNWEFVYPPLLHSKWDGCTPTDLVFPFFMFIVGAAMWYSYKKYNYNLTGNLVLKILRRSFLIYLIGFLLNIYSKFTLDLSNVRIMGVLARIAIAYGIASFIVLCVRLNYVKVLLVLILLGYWAILAFLGSDSPYSLEGNFTRTFDNTILGINHIPVFHGVKFDQTGLLSTLPSIANVLLGYLAGRLIDTSEIKMNAVKKLIILGITGIFLAIGWDLIFPINKPLWTSSFVLYTCGFASFFLGILLWITDVKGFTTWIKPFQVFGMNSIFIYGLAGFLATTLNLIVLHPQGEKPVNITAWIYNNCFMPMSGNYAGSFLYALTFTLICWFAGWILYRKKIFIKL